MTHIPVRALVAFLVAAPAFAMQETRVSVFSGLVVPRYANLKFDRVNGRSGPGLQYPVLWKYRKVGLPVIVIRESPEWRKIRDPVGDETWVHKRMVTTSGNALVQRETAIYPNADASTDPLAIVENGVVVALTGCEKQWCMVVAERYRGWVPRASLWGVDAAVRGGGE